MVFALAVALLLVTVILMLTLPLWTKSVDAVATGLQASAASTL